MAPPPPAHRLQLVVQVLPELVLVCHHVVHAERGQVVARGAETDGLGDGWGASLEARGRREVGRALRRHLWGMAREGAACRDEDGVGRRARTP